MNNSCIAQLTAALRGYSSMTRLYGMTLGRHTGTEANPALLVEAFAGHDSVDAIGQRDVIVLSTIADGKLELLLGQYASVDICLANGRRACFSGEITEVQMLGSDGGFARYLLRLSPWLWRLGQVRNSRVWQDKTVIEIVDDVLWPYLPFARWRWSDACRPFMALATPRSYCCQYRESDLAFVRRLLAQEGVCWRFEHTDTGVGMVLFADSTLPCDVPENPCSAQGDGIAYHAALAVERADTVQALSEERSLHTAQVTVLSGNLQFKQAVSASSPTRVAWAAGLPRLECYDTPGESAYAHYQDALRHANLHMEALEARSACWQGRSTVRSLRAGTRMRITGLPRRAPRHCAALTVLQVRSVGVNNLPPAASAALAELFGPLPELLEQTLGDAPFAGQDQVVAQAIASGYANWFEAIPADQIWRPQFPEGDGRLHAKPSAHGSQTATVIGADGADRPQGANVLCCDGQGRVRIRFHWEDGCKANCWVPVAQHLAGNAMGCQFLPRIGQEVWVQFLENNIDRPVIVGALYNGQGEGGVVPTPGGQVKQPVAGDVFAPARDHAPSGQYNLYGGHSPVWHGSSWEQAGHANGAAQWGWRSQEFGGSGYNQLLFDDTDAQGRIALTSSSAATALNLGHLIHAADNYRGSFRGLGAELRSDGGGALRGGAGCLVSSYKPEHNAEARTGAGENAAAVALLEQARALAKHWSDAALLHQSVGLGMHMGAAAANASLLDSTMAPLAAMANALAGQVDDLQGAPADPAPGNTVPHLGAPLIALSAAQQFGAVAAQSLQLANGESALLASSGDTQAVAGGRLHMHAGQAIGVLGGATGPGADGAGLQLISAKDAIIVAAHSGSLKVQARDAVDVISTHAHIDWAAAKRISLTTAGGANITIEGGHITVQCPGKIMVQAGVKHFLGPARRVYPLPALPASICVECLLKARAAAAPFVLRSA